MSYDINQDGTYHWIIQNIINGGDVSWNENWKVLNVQKLELSIGEQLSFTHSNYKLQHSQFTILLLKTFGLVDIQFGQLHVQVAFGNKYELTLFNDDPLEVGDVCNSPHW